MSPDSGIVSARNRSDPSAFCVVPLRGGGGGWSRRGSAPTSAPAKEGRYNQRHHADLEALRSGRPPRGVRGSLTPREDAAGALAALLAHGGQPFAVAAPGSGAKLCRSSRGKGRGDHRFGEAETTSHPKKRRRRRGPGALGSSEREREQTGS